MRRIPILPLFVFAVLVSLIAPPLSASADGVIVVDPPACDPACPDPVLIADQLNIRSHRVDVSIADQVATTRIDQVFHNPEQLGRRRNLHLPIPPGAAISGFTMTVDGEPVEAKLLDASEARASTTTSCANARSGPARIHRRGRHPGQRLPYPARRRPPRRDRIRRDRAREDGPFPLPVPAEHRAFLRAAAGEVSVHVGVETRDPLRAIYSPSHDIAVDRPDDFHFAAGYEASDVRPDTDFELYLECLAGRRRRQRGHLRRREHWRGVFPPSRRAWDRRRDGDRRQGRHRRARHLGQHGGREIEQAQEALLYVLQHLNAG